MNKLGFYRNYKKNSKLTNRENIFREDTFEYHLVEYIRESYSCPNPNNITEYLAKKNIKEYVDIWNYAYLTKYAESLARSIGVLEIDNSNRFSDQIKRFAVYIEDGMTDLLNNELYTKFEKEIEGKDKKNNFWISLHINKKVRDFYKLPTMKYKEMGCVDISINNYKMIPYQMDKLEFPLGAWSYCGSTEEWMGIKSRGLVHHVGDSSSFLLAAAQYGETYIVGINEFGNLVVLGALGQMGNINTSFNIFDEVNKRDFDYIYGVPKGENTYITKSSYQKYNKSSGDCKINDELNAEYSEKFWNNQVFLKHAGRQILELTPSELIEKFTTAVKIEVGDNNILYDLFMGHESELIKKYKKLIIKNNCNFLIFCQESLKSDTNENHTDIDNFLNENKEYFLYERNWTELLENIKNKSSFFYKSKAHKSFCDIVNPKDKSLLGFFLKNDGQEIEDTSIEYYYLIYELLNIVNLKKENVNKLIWKKFLINGNLEVKYNLIEYWDSIKEKSFLVSEVIDMKNEYRIFIVDNKVATASPCFRDTTPLNAWQRGRFDPRLCDGHSAKHTYQNQHTRNRVAKYAKFARLFCNEMKKIHPNCKNYVLDVAWSDDLNKVVPIEINSITWSGAYQINMNRLCAAIAQQKFYYEDLITNKYSYIKMKQDVYKELKEKNIVCGTENVPKDGLEKNKHIYTKEYNNIDEYIEPNYNYEFVLKNYDNNLLNNNLLNNNIKTSKDFNILKKYNKVILDEDAVLDNVFINQIYEQKINLIVTENVINNMDKKLFSKFVIAGLVSFDHTLTIKDKEVALNLIKLNPKILINLINVLSIELKDDKDVVEAGM